MVYDTDILLGVFNGSKTIINTQHALFLVEVDSSSLRRTPQDGAGLVRLPGCSWVDLFVWIAYM